MAPCANPCGCINLKALKAFADGFQQNADPLATALAQAKAELPSVPRSTGHIFKNGVIRTMVDGDADKTVEAVAINGDEIVSAGTLESCRAAAPGAEEVDLAGKCVLPGLIEPHVHMLPTSIYDTWVPLSPFDGQDLVGAAYKLDWVYDTLKAALDRGEVTNGWLVGFGVDPSMFSDMSPAKDWMDPDAAGLDSRVSSEVCIFLMNSSGHVGYANTAGLRAAGSSNTSGVLTELEMIPVMATAVGALAASGPAYAARVLQSMFHMFREAAAVGVTTLFDAALGATSTKLELDMFKVLAHSGLVPQRLGGGLVVGSDDAYKSWRDKFGITNTTYSDDKFHVPNIKIVSDGSNQGLTGFQHEPYPHPNPLVNGPGHECGEWNLEGVDYKKLMADMVADGWTLMIHGNGDAAIDRLIEGYREVLESTGDKPLDKRHRIEHCSILTDKMLDELVELGVSPSFLIGHVGYWGKTMAENVFGPKKAQLLDRAGSAAQRGMRFTLHSDHFVSPFGPLRMAEQAVRRDMEAIEGVYAPLNKAECIDIRRALKAITYDAAWQTDMDRYIGQLKTGMKADLVVLAEDPVAMDSVEGLRHVKVCQTWMGGRRTHVSK